MLEDMLQSDRIRMVVDGDAELGFDGLLAITKDCQSTESCRAYQCIKTLVSATNRSNVVKEYLLETDPDRWQWCVNWLKDRMSSGGGLWGGGGGARSPSEGVSNESARTFQRTTSAQVTLDEANAIMAELSSSSRGGTAGGGDEAASNNNSTASSMDTDTNKSVATMEDDDDMVPDLQDMTTS